MTLTTDLSGVLSKLDKRVYTVEQLVTSSAVVGGGGGGSNFDTITIGEEIVLATTPPGVPTGLTVTTGTFFDNTYADVEWADPVETTIEAVSFTVELARKDVIAGTYSLAQVVTTFGNNNRFENLDPGQVYGVRVRAISPIGRFSTETGWVDFTAAADQTVPDAPTGLGVFRGATTVVVKFNESTAVDVILNKGFYEVEIDTVNTFTSGNLRRNRTSAIVVGFNDITTEAFWYARVRAVDSSGNVSPWVTSGATYAGGVTDNMVVYGLNAAKITFGQMHGDRIQANTISVATLTSGTITSTTITIGSGGSINIGNPPTSGIHINSQGIRGYRFGSQTFALDSGGTVTMSGNINGSTITGSSITGTTITGGTIYGAHIATASSGARIVLDPGFSGGRIRLITSGGTEAYIIVGYTGTTIMQLVAGSSNYIRIQDNPGSFSSNMVHINTNNVFRVDATSVLIPTIYHDSAVGGRPLGVTSAGWVGYTSTSTLRMKRDVVKFADQDSLLSNITDKVLDLDLVTFVYKDDEEGIRPQVGMIVEWAEETLGDYAKYFVHYDDEGRPDLIKYEMLPIVLIPLIKQMRDQLQEIKEKNGTPD